MEGAAIPNHGGDPVDGRTGISDDCHISVDGDTANVCTPSDAFTSFPEESNSESPSPSTSSRDALARGISSLLGSVLKDFDLRATQTITSQDNLSSSIDRLTQELDRLLEDAPLPFIMQHAARISSVRRRVASMNTVLKSVQRRVDNIDRILSVASQSHPGIGEGLEKQNGAVSAGLNVFKDSTSSRSQANDLEGAD